MEPPYFGIGMLGLGEVGGRVGGVIPSVSSYFGCYFLVALANGTRPIAQYQKYDSGVDFVNSHGG